MTPASRAAQQLSTADATDAPKLDEQRLLMEAKHLHRALLGGEAPEEVRRQYARALQGAALAGFPRCDLTGLIERGVDVEALELALRRVARVNALTQRLHVLCYLVEIRAESFPLFVNERSSLLGGWFALGWHTVRSFCKLIKGRWLMRVYHVR